MGTWGRSQQVCATCRYWGGERDIDFFAQVFEVLDSPGMCRGPFGSFRGVETDEGGSCSEWESFRDD